MCPNPQLVTLLLTPELLGSSYFSFDSRRRDAATSELIVSWRLH